MADGAVFDLGFHEEQREAMIAHAEFCWPNEACGLIAADGSDATMVYCLTNLDESPYRFTLDPAEHYAAWRHATDRGWRIAGSFHSHPSSAASMSQTDVDGALDPDWIYVVVGPVRPGPAVAKAYSVRHGEALELKLLDAS
ncbi:MAG: M67 family metallopeptidase [Acidimicrobiia bacterium]